MHDSCTPRPRYRAAFPGVSARPLWALGCTRRPGRLPFAAGVQALRPPCRLPLSPPFLLLTVPQIPLTCSSSLPSEGFVPLTSLMS